ncbi:hypothetical protein HYY74_06350 [Candidatus Woesearchaeota archaeon]|nr:hypothetical protein [Candidatus Woesearchaeota archaeon]
MKAAIMVSKANIASLNIMERLLEDYPFTGSPPRLSVRGNSFEVHQFDGEITHLEGIDSGIDADLLVFASTHRSSAAIDCFTVHAVGNWGKAELGGRERSLVIAPAAELKAAFQSLQKNRLGMEVIQEATHHGPFVEKPAMFIEIGSSEKMYRDRQAAEEVAGAIMSLGEAQKPVKAAVGIGGPHHSPAFSKFMRESEYAVGHVCAKYALDCLDAGMLRQAMERTEPRAGIALLDWKGLGGHKQRIKSFIEDEGIPWQKA